MKIIDLMEDGSQTYFVKTFKPLYHGTELSTGNYEFRFRAKPKDTFGPIHNTVSKLSKKKFGINVRALLFASFNKSEADFYGTVRFLVPLGENYRLFYHPNLDDMTTGMSASYTSVRVELIAIVTSNVLDDQPDKRLRETLKLFIMENHGDSEDGFEKFIEDYKKYTFKTLDELEHEYNAEAIVSQIDNYQERKMRNINYYIENIRELKTPEEADTLDHEEIMVYAPDGFRIENDRSKIEK